ncbi:MAG: HAD family hydrolase [Clostridiales bacterium]|nr:HAD family hydrolase [Clostridiales bacterium]
MNKAVFLDRDGTINVDKGYLYRICDFELLPGVVEGLKLLQDAGYLLIVISNQSGIARGYYTEEDLLSLHCWMTNMLGKEGVYLKGIYYCPHHPKGIIPKYSIQCKCRKPELELFYRAVDEYKIELSKSWAIGDKIRDCCICENSSCRGFLVGTNEKKEVIERVENHFYSTIQHVAGLYEAAKIIIQEDVGA